MEESEVVPATIYVRVKITQHNGEYTAEVQDYPETKSISRYKKEAVDGALYLLHRKLSQA